jgi:hypothetical protein
LHPMREHRVHCLEPQQLHVHDQQLPVWAQRIRYRGRGRAHKNVVQQRAEKREACVQVLPRGWNTINNNHENLSTTGSRERVHMRIRDRSDLHHSLRRATREIRHAHAQKRPATLYQRTQGMKIVSLSSHDVTDFACPCKSSSRDLT